MATYALTIDGTPRDIRPGWTITKQANAIGTMTFEIVSLGGAYRPAIGDEVILTEDTGSGAVRIFGGTIDAPAEARIDGISDWDDIVLRCSAVDFNELIDRRVLNLTIPAGNLKAGLQALEPYTDDYGVELDATQADGPDLPELVFSFTTLRAAYNHFAELTDWVYRIDDYKKMKMVPPATTACPFDVVDGDGHAVGDVVAELRREEFANVVHVLGGSGQQTVEDAFTGDGSEDTWELTYTLAGHQGYVVINGTVPEGLGASGSGAVWEYTTTGGVTSITRTLGAPGNGDTIDITYTGQFPKLVTATASPDPEDRVERIYRYPDVFDATVLQALADNRLARQNVERQTVQFSTRETGILPGQTLTITIADRDLDDTYLVRSVTTTTLTETEVIRRVSCERGTAYVDDSWQRTVGSWGSGGAAGGGAVAVTTVTAGGVGGIGTSGTLARWSGGALLTDSIVSESGTIVTVAGSLRVSSAAAVTDFHESDAATDQKYWRWIANGATFALQTVNDAYNAVLATPLSIARAGAASFSSSVTAAGVIRSTSANGWAMGSVAGVARIDHGVVADSFRFVTSANHLANTIGLTGTFFGHVLPGANMGGDVGASSTKWRTLYAAEVQFDTLVAREILSTIGGNILVANTTILTADLAAAATTITVKHNSLVNGDRIRLQARGQVEWMAITSSAGGSAGAYTYSVTRNLDGTGANDWIAGDAVVSTGTTGNGFIDLYATSGVLVGTGPTIVGNVRTGTTWNHIAPRWAIGNLNSVGYASINTNVFGAAFGDPSTAHIIIDATNGIRMRHGSTSVMTLDTSGNASFSGSITATSGTIGGWTIGSTSLTGGNATLASSGNLTLGTGNNVVRLSADDGTYRLWVGHATAGSAPFRVTAGGEVTMTDANVTGTITGSTISGSEAYFGGSNQVTLDDDGITIDAGTGGANAIKWTDGSEIISRTDTNALFLSGPGVPQINIYDFGTVIWGNTTNGIIFDVDAVYPWNTDASHALGTEERTWSELYLSTVGAVGAAITDHESRITALEAFH